MKSPESSMPCKGMTMNIDLIKETRSSNLTLQVSHSFGQNENGRGKKKTKYTTDLEMSPKYFLNTEEKKPTANDTLGCDPSAIVTEPRQIPPPTGAHAHSSGQPTLKAIRNLSALRGPVERPTYRQEVNLD
ncbi:hypothetical protein FCIRC_7387 [Fusarium circinatum]|uniref:Uncharacterized protein n=1 Tax=Fusarium circinatum TaxID=48490 RepID=A0A8H5TTW9_FUSCI|nr:hypothetical protein FCIRC_7387 [Fusarium circinatum]